MGIPCLGLNGGPAFQHSEAFSFQVATADQTETDRYWNAIVGNGGQESECGWCKDRWGMSWQITPIALTRGDHRPGLRRREARVRCDDADEERYIAAIEAACAVDGARVGGGRLTSGPAAKLAVIVGSASTR